MDAFFCKLVHGLGNCLLIFTVWPMLIDFYSLAEMNAFLDEQDRMEGPGTDILDTADVSFHCWLSSCFNFASFFYLFLSFILFTV